MAILASVCQHGRVVAFARVDPTRRRSGFRNLPCCCKASNWATLTRARRDWQNSHERLAFASSGPRKCRSKRRLRKARRQAYESSSSNVTERARGEASKRSKADMLAGVRGIDCEIDERIWED